MNKKVDSKGIQTGWGNVASWYESTVNAKFSYQKDLILPTLLKFVLRENLASKNILDLGCGTGFFVEEFAKYEPTKVVGIDVDDELLLIAQEKVRQARSQPTRMVTTRKGVNTKEVHNTFNTEVVLEKLAAENLSQLKEGSFDFIFAIESLVNMKDLEPVIKGIKAKLAKGGRFIAVVNHPAFRIPQSSDWYYDEKKKMQGRVVYNYKTSRTIKIDMNPGKKAHKKYTYTFHRSFEEYVNLFAREGLYLTRIKEVCSNKRSETGPRQNAENLARTEIPLFLFMEFGTL